MVAMSYFCRQNVSQISLEIVANWSHPSEILALVSKVKSRLYMLVCLYTCQDATLLEIAFADNLKQ